MNRSNKHITANRRAMICLEHRNNKLERDNKDLRKFKKSIEELMILIHPHKNDVYKFGEETAINGKDIIEGIRGNDSCFLQMKTQNPRGMDTSVLKMRHGGYDLHFVKNELI